MGVGWEVDGREGDVAEEAGGRAFVEADETEITYDPEGGAFGWCAFCCGFDELALDLEADFDDFERVREDLFFDLANSQNKG